MPANGTAATFLRSAGSDLFWSNDAAFVRRLAFLSSGTLGGDRATLAQTWADLTGVYVVFEAMQQDAGKDAALAKALRTYLTWMGWPALGQRVLWLHAASTSGGPSPFAMSGPTIDMAMRSGAGVLRRGADFDFAGYVVSCAAGSTIAASGDGTALVLSGAGALTTPGRPYPAKDGTITIAMTGAAAGCLRFAIELKRGGETVDNDFDSLSVGLRYGQPGADALVDILHLPVLRQPAAPLVLHATFDPLHPLDPARSRLSFFPDGGGPAPPAMVSNFTTARGHEVRLTPSAAGARPAGFVFAVQPLVAGEPGTVPTRHYFTLDGEFEFAAGAHRAEQVGDVEAIERLVCGASGLEYVGFPDRPGHRLVFLPGHPAFAPAPGEIVPDAPQLTMLGTTAWAYARAAEGSVLNYFSQPDQAPLFAAADNAILRFLEVPSVTLPAPDGTHAFPVAAYLGIAPELAARARALEVRAIAPERQRALARLGARHLAAMEVVNEQVGVTPQGLAVGIDASDLLNWSWLGIAKSRESAGLPDIRFTRITGAFKQAMQANRLFAVLANADAVMNSGSVPYLLTADAIKQIRAAPQGVPVAIIDAVAAAMTGVAENTEAAFVAGLRAAAPAITPAQESVFLREAGQLAVEIDTWRFQISPRNWSNPLRPRRKNAFLIFKLTRDRSLKDYVADPGSWTWPDAARIGGSVEAAAAELAAIIADAEAADRAQPGADNPYRHFVKEVVVDNNWCGIVCLGCDVPLESLPAALRPLEVGIDPARFHAHHVGFNLTPFSSAAGVLSFQRTSMFGLIDYNDPVDQVLETNIDFAFKVLRLSVGFRNSAISSFSSRIELMVNRLFGMPAWLYPTDHGNNLILDGTYQQQLGSDDKLHGTYLFASAPLAPVDPRVRRETDEPARQNMFQIPNSALRYVEVVSTRLVTNPPGSGADADQVSGMFQISGKFRFWDSQSFDPFCFGAVAPKRLPDGDVSALLAGTPEEEEEEWVETPFGFGVVVPGTTVRPGDIKRRPEPSAAEAVDAPPTPEGEDGYLNFDNLGVSMAFDRFVRKPAFSLVTDAVSFDLAHSRPRPDSLASRFPVRLRRLVAVPNLAKSRDGPPSGQDPKDLGYASATAHGLQQSRLTPPWFGLEYELNLGTLGALAAGAGLVMTVLAGWSAGGTDEQPAVYFGLHLPGMKDALGVELPLQGVMKIGFRSIEFSTYPVSGTTPAQLAYLIRFRNFGLHVLGLSFPPGHNDIYLFGNPNQASTTTLGWYAAYAADEDKKKKNGTRRNARLLATRRLPNVGDGEGAS